MTEANGHIYIFGSSDEGEEPKSVLWAFETRVNIKIHPIDEEEWRKFQEIGSLTARPHQRAVLSKEIVDWDYAN